MTKRQVVDRPWTQVWHMAKIAYPCVICGGKIIPGQQFGYGSPRRKAHRYCLEGRKQ